MRTARLLPGVLIALVLTGCMLWQRGKVDPRAVNSIEVDGLVVGIEMPKHAFNPGERAPVTVTARNKTAKPMTIEATSGAPLFVRIWRHTGIGWDEVKRYPQATTMVMKSWTLAPGAERTFRLLLPIEPDWPTSEPLRVTCELNGRPEAAPQVIIRVDAAAQEAE